MNQIENIKYGWMNNAVYYFLHTDDKKCPVVRLEQKNVMRRLGLMSFSFFDSLFMLQKSCNKSCRFIIEVYLYKISVERKEKNTLANYCVPVSIM